MSGLTATGAADRLHTTSERLGQLTARLEALRAGRPTTPADAELARARNRAQAEALTAARHRLVRTHRDASARHQVAAGLFDQAGMTERAAAQRRAAALAMAAARRAGHLDADGTRPVGPRLDPARLPTPSAPPPSAPSATAPARRPLLETELLRRALVSMLASGTPSTTTAAAAFDLLEERRRFLSQAVVAQVGTLRWRGWAHALCVVGRAYLPGVDGVCITVHDDQLPVLLAASDDWSLEVEQVHHVVGEGPAVTAYREGAAVRVDALGAEAALWPIFAASVADADVAGVWALPLHLRGVCVGSVTLYRRRSHVGPPIDRADADHLLGLAETALLADLPGIRQGSVPHDPYAEVFIASGVLSHRLGVPVPEALLRMRAHAFTQGMSLTAVASLVLRTEVDLA